MKITDVQVRKVDLDNRTKAYVTITIDDCFVVRDIRVVDGKSGLFIAMPSRKRPNGHFRDIAHPINTETRRMIEEAILAEYGAEESDESSQDAWLDDEDTGDGVTGDTEEE